jgi:urease accessory protein
MTSSASTSACKHEPTAPGLAPDGRDGFGPGRGSIEVCATRDGRSVVSRAFAASPLRLLTPRNHGRAAWIYSSSFGGGLVDGDRVELDIDVHGGASAYLSTQASTKVYRSARGSATVMRAHVAPGGTLVVMPDPVVCFAQSRYTQAQRFDVSARSRLVVVDWLSSGRAASGERWQFDEYVSGLQVHVDGRLVMHDAMALRAEDGPLEARLGRFDVLALAVVIGDDLCATSAGIIEQVGRAPVTRRDDLLVAAAAVGPGGCLMRIAGRSVEQVGQMLREYLAIVPSMLGDNPWARKW